MSAARIVITGGGAICGVGQTPDAILAALLQGRSAIGRITQWDTEGWPVRIAAEVQDYNAGKLTGDRKLLKHIRRGDVFGLYAADQAIEQAGFNPWRETLDDAGKERFADGTGVYVGSGGGTFGNQYDYFPLIAAAKGELKAFGQELAATVNPLWLLRSLPNNVLGHVGIRQGLKGPNACITHHSISGLLALAEATAALRAGECTRAVVAAHEAPIEPQVLLYYQRMGLLSAEALRPFDARHDGSAMGEGAAALTLETEAAAAERGATVLGEVLGFGSAGEALGLLPVRDDGDGLVRAIQAALTDAGLQPAQVGMVVAHANGTPNSDRSEARALAATFGADMPPVTGFKWAFGHLLAAAGLIDAVLAVSALRAGVVPGIAELGAVDIEGAPVNASAEHRKPRSDVVLVISRGFGGTNAACLLRAAAA